MKLTILENWTNISGLVGFVLWGFGMVALFRLATRLTNTMPILFGRVVKREDVPKIFWRLFDVQSYSLTRDLLVAAVGLAGLFLFAHASDIQRSAPLTPTLSPRGEGV